MKCKKDGGTCGYGGMCDECDEAGLSAVEPVVSSRLATCYAYISRRGLVLADTDFDTPERAWSVGLGWPSESEIAAAKKKGCRVAKVAIYEIDGC